MCCQSVLPVFHNNFGLSFLSYPSTQWKQIKASLSVCQWFSDIFHMNAKTPKFNLFSAFIPKDDSYDDWISCIIAKSRNSTCVFKIKFSSCLHYRASLKDPKYKPECIDTLTRSIIITITFPMELTTRYLHEWWLLMSSDYVSIHFWPYQDQNLITLTAVNPDEFHTFDLILQTVVTTILEEQFKTVKPYMLCDGQSSWSFMLLTQLSGDLQFQHH